jgi:hypothetical protein
MEKPKIEGDLLTSTNNINKNDLNLLREKFIDNYSSKKGWDKSNLSPNQLLEIVEQKGYKNPGILYS